MSEVYIGGVIDVSLSGFFAQQLKDVGLEAR